MNDKLLKLGYTTLWMELGILTEQKLNEQVAIYETGDDKNTEHYRYGAFRDYLTSHRTLTDTELDNYLKLANLETDKPMANSAIADIFREIELTDLQFNKVRAIIAESWF